MKTFTINNRTYKAIEPDFNFMADYGESLNNPMRAARAYLSFCGRLSEEQAGLELNSHILNGGNVQQIMDVLSSAIEESDFFRKLRENQEEEVATETEKTATKKSKQ